MGSADKPSASDTIREMNSLAAVCLAVIAPVLCLSSVPGIPGQDYPTLDFYNLPATSFECRGRVNGGFYSDEEAFCQMYQEKLVCDAWFNVDCSENTISNDASTLDLLDAERTFITLGLESDEPEIDFPWRYRNGV